MLKINKKSWNSWHNNLSILYKKLLMIIGYISEIYIKLCTWQSFKNNSEIEVIIDTQCFLMFHKGLWKSQSLQENCVLIVSVFFFFASCFFFTMLNIPLCSHENPIKRKREKGIFHLNKCQNTSWPTCD